MRKNTEGLSKRVNAEKDAELEGGSVQAFRVVWENGHNEGVTEGINENGGVDNNQTLWELEFCFLFSHSCRV